MARTSTGGNIAELLTMSELTRRTGLPRTSIHFYLREGLLPQPHKTAVNRAYYTQDHVDMALRIKTLREKGLSLARIKADLREDLAAIEANGADALARESERVRETILRVATEEFMDRGYDGARVADIVRKAGVTSQVFYAHFPSKVELLVESFKTFMSWNLAFVEPHLQSADAGQRLLSRLQADAKANELGSSVLSAIGSEEPGNRDLATLVEQAWAPIITHIVADLQSAVPPGDTPKASLELLAYSLLGAMHNTSARASWDERFTREDIITTHLWLYLALLAGLSGETDINGQIERYRDQIKETATRRPVSPPAPEES